MPVYSLSTADYLGFDIRFARAYHLGGLLFYAMGQQRYVDNHNCACVTFKNFQFI